MDYTLDIICNLPGDKHKTLSIESTSGSFYLTFIVNQTVAEVKASIFDKFKKIDLVKTAEKSVDDYILKVTGFRSYFVSLEKPFISYDCILYILNTNCLQYRY
jgi:hypothetical protein